MSEINYYYEIGSLKPCLDTIFNDMCSDDDNYRGQGESNLMCLVDIMRILARLKRGTPLSEIRADSPGGECLIERLESDMSHKVL